MTKLKYLYNVNYILRKLKLRLRQSLPQSTIQSYLYDDDNAEFVIAGY